MKNSIEINDVVKKYDSFLLDHIDFVVPIGSVVGFVGENGAGKSTTLKLLLDLIHKDDGKITIFGHDHQTLTALEKQEIGVVLDDSFLSEYLTITDVNNIMKGLYHNWDETLFFHYTKKFSLPTKKLIKEFSSGMKMKIKVISALSHHPRLLILDEPTSGLDPIARTELLDIFREFMEDETHSILISSHITSDLEHIADYLVFIHNGKIILKDEVQNLLEQYGILKCSFDEFQTLQKEDYITYVKQKYSYEVLVSDKDKIRKKYSFSVIDKPNIEDIMVLYVKGEKE